MGSREAGHEKPSRKKINSLCFTNRHLWWKKSGSQGGKRQVCVDTLVKSILEQNIKSQDLKVSPDNCWTRQVTWGIPVELGHLQRIQPMLDMGVLGRHLAGENGVWHLGGHSGGCGECLHLHIINSSNWVFQTGFGSALDLGKRVKFQKSEQQKDPNKVLHEIAKRERRQRSRFACTLHRSEVLVSAA